MYEVNATIYNISEKTFACTPALVTPNKLKYLIISWKALHTSSTTHLLLLPRFSHFELSTTTKIPLKLELLNSTRRVLSVAWSVIPENTEACNVYSQNNDQFSLCKVKVNVYLLLSKGFQVKRTSAANRVYFLLKSESCFESCSTSLWRKADCSLALSSFSTFSRSLIDFRLNSPACGS